MNLKSLIDLCLLNFLMIMFMYRYFYFCKITTLFNDTQTFEIGIMLHVLALMVEALTNHFYMYFKTNWFNIIITYSCAMAVAKKAKKKIVHILKSKLIMLTVFNAKLEHGVIKSNNQISLKFYTSFSANDSFVRTHTWSPHYWCTYKSTRNNLQINFISTTITK